jgi:SMODS domain-containing protein
MRHVDLFNDFLTDAVNLNDTRITELETSTEAIKNAVRASTWTPHLSGWMAQGSWAHKTIIKPVDQGEFDADLIVFVQPVDGWDAAKYIDTLVEAFKANSTYKDIGRFADFVRVVTNFIVLSADNQCDTNALTPFQMPPVSISSSCPVNCAPIEQPSCRPNQHRS